MQANQKIMLSLIPTLLIFLPSGCTLTKEPGKFSLLPISAQRSEQNIKQLPSGYVAKRFQEPAPQGPTVVQSAIELSQKYAKLSEEMTVLQQKKQDLIAENHRLKDQLASLRPKLKQTQKELTEANDLLIEMRIELNNWKTDVLGFRNEMRGAEKAQLEALYKILMTLGGEVKAKSTQNENTNSAVVTLNEPGKSQSQQIPTLGESNE